MSEPSQPSPPRRDVTDGDAAGTPKRKFRIQRRRLGKIISLGSDSKFGFIDSEDYRDDVFFHRDVWDGKVVRDGKNIFVKPEEGLWVEFELDDDWFEDQKKLRAKVCRPTTRPIGRKLSGRDATFKIVTHHPNARRKRPSWRK